MGKSVKSIPLGIREEYVSPGDHIAYFWEDDAEFDRGVEFLAVGIRAGEHSVVFGHPEANAKVIEALRGRGIDIDSLKGSGRFTELGGESEGDAMLSSIGGVFQKAVENGAELIRLLGNIGWGHPDWPGQDDILAFESKVTGAAKAFPCVVVCMYDVNSLPGRTMVHGAFETHPLTFCRNVLRENPFYVGVDEFLSSVAPIDL